MEKNVASGKLYNLDLFFEHSPDLLCIAGFDGYFKKVNRSWTRLLGYTENELISKPIDSFVVPEDGKSTVLSRQAVTSGQALLNFENRYLCKNGNSVWLSWTSFPIPEQSLVYGIAKDVSYRKRLEMDRLELIGRMEKIIEEMKQASYAASHDLRSPVNNLLSLFSLLDQTKINDRETGEFLQLMRYSTSQLKDTLDRYLDAISSDLRDETLYNETTDLALLMKEVTGSVNILIQATGAKIYTDFNAWRYLCFSKHLLYSILLNLLTNSIKYNRPGVPLDVSVVTKIADGKKQLVFKDNGIGFDLEQIGHRVFGFGQKFTEEADSSGIGLYLVYNHLRACGGTIDLQSKPNEGAVFTITFP